MKGRYRLWITVCICILGIFSLRLAANHNSVISNRNSRILHLTPLSRPHELQPKTVALSSDSTRGSIARHAGLGFPPPARVIASYRKILLTFEVNEGQVDNRVRFLSRADRYTIFLTSDEAVLSLRQGISRRHPRSQGRMGVGLSSHAPWSFPTRIPHAKPCAPPASDCHEAVE